MQIYIMRILITLLLATITSAAMSQSLKFKITGQKDTTIHLVKYLGAKLYYADTAEIKGGIVEFDGKKQKPGMMAVLLPGQKMFEFIYNNEDVQIETQGPDFISNMKVKKSEENKIFLPYIQFIGAQKSKAVALTAERDKLDKNSKEYTAKNDEINALSAEVVKYQENIVKNNPNKLVSKIIYMSQDIDVPEPPVDENGVILDSNFRFNYFRAHYFDHIDFNNDALVNTSIFASKLEYYFSNKMMVPHWDTVIKYAFQLCDQLNPKSKMFEYCVSWITSNYGKSKQMGMDKVYVYMADRYYCSKNEEGKSPAFWMTEEKLNELCEKVSVQKNLVMGVVPPNIILRDTTDKNWVNMYADLDAEYTVLYFWDPECGHCKKITPKLQTLYEQKFKERGIEIYAVGKAVGDDFEKWKKFIRTNNLEFYNVAVTESLFKAAKEDARQFIPKYTTIESLNYQSTYDIYATPRVFVLNKNHEIIAKQISISQLEDLMDRLQNKTDLPKLFPPDPEEDEQMN